MTRTGPTAAAMALLAAIGTATASAQDTGRIAIGATVGLRTPGDPAALSSGPTAGLLWRLGQSREGWGWHFGFGWYGADVAVEGAGEALTARLGVKPFVVGYAYTHVMGRTSISGGLMGGYAFTSIRPDDRFVNTLARPDGHRSVAVDVANTFVARPGVSVWRNLSDRIGLNVNASYTIARPRLAVGSPGAATVRRLNADMFSLKAGLVYSIF